MVKAYKFNMMLKVTMVILSWCVMVSANQAVASPLLPFPFTGDLFVLDSGSDSILSIAPDGTVSVAVTKAQILAATLEAFVNFDNNGIAFDGVVGGDLFFTEAFSDSILKLSGGVLSVLTSEADIIAETGEGSADPDAIAFDSTGSLFVNDDSSDSVLKVNPTTGTVSVHTSEAAFLALVGITSVDLGGGIVGGLGGVIYTVSDGTPDAIFEIASDGTPSILASGSPFSDLDVFMTRAPNGGPNRV